MKREHNKLVLNFQKMTNEYKNFKFKKEVYSKIKKLKLLKNKG